MAKPTKAELLDALYDKYQLLYDFLQELNARLDPDERPNHEGTILNTELEIERVKDAYYFIADDRPIPFPSQKQVDDLALATGALEKVVGINKAIDAMIDAATAVIKTWPVSKGG